MVTLPEAGEVEEEDPADESPPVLLPLSPPELLGSYLKMVVSYPSPAWMMVKLYNRKSVERISSMLAV